MTEEQKREECAFCCPICGRALRREGRSLRCEANHSFDIAAQGYVHLLPANKKHSALPGDDKQMVAARRDFLEAGWYQPFSDRLNQLVADFLRPEDGRCCSMRAAARGIIPGGSPRRSTRG